MWLIPTVDRFPRRRKFLLGGRIQSTRSRGAGATIGRGRFTRSRSRLLHRVNVDLDKRCLLLRLAKGSGCLGTRRDRGDAGEIDRRRSGG